MKRLFVTFAAFVLVEAAHAQTTPGPHPAGPIEIGSLMLGGAADVTHTKSDDVSSTSVTIAPDLLTFVRHGLAIGGSLLLGYTHLPQGHETDLGAGPAARLYFGGERVLPFVNVATLLVRVRNTSKVDSPQGGVENSTVRETAWQLDASAGLTIMLSRQVGIDGETYVQRFFATAKIPGPTVEERHLGVTLYGLRFGVRAFIF
jgi:hypothetical protein